MAVLGRLLKNRRAGEAGLAWNTPNLAGPETLRVTSADFEHEATLPVAHAGKRSGGQNTSPALSWTGTPARATQLLLVVEDLDVPLPKPFVHGVFLLDAAVTEVARGALDENSATAGVRVLRSGKGRGYLGADPIKGHGPHRYAFQLFALAQPITASAGGADLESAKPRAVLDAAGEVLARGRIDGLYENP
ncbi:YbhB/YbcL family Raf kinase inhibitor-like protein [Streptantibioticus silvisoli]|uniref:YbhB/YbcL family Raf kinase inhibitor-like protein n=1 Tax=Streptantibioticus silvisoli TaxID=2705255 RepID=A0ABT6W1V3_9ACTN|nr:YbhB/YbcL family Raf kinase inhibitor-like protein [Streptantibioticus silvisoli]MDI5963486.1 YbhB/YbcL family Raf kinase inhibitor-like protein [Streptantibioticus silvisoli]